MPLKLWYDEKPIYIAVHHAGFGIHEVPAMAIRLAQMQIKAEHKEAQLLIYKSFSAIEPIGFKNGAPIWPHQCGNGRDKRGKRINCDCVFPRLVGLTSTHRGFRQTPR